MLGTGRTRSALFGIALVCAQGAFANEPRSVEVDFSVSHGELRAVQGINKGPLGAGGFVDLTAALTKLHVPFARMHDCHWPNPDVIDVSAIFPNAGADPARAESYDFRLTDEYLNAVRATGARIIYRLGESIEHTSVKRRVNPPADAAHWAAVCAGIVRHYNEGWAGGFHHGILYWEIWNEPENRPACWTGTDAEFFTLFKTTARTLRESFPALKIGGPGVGNSGGLNGEQLRPSPFLSAFLDFCAHESVPLDFLSWHCYTDAPAELATRAKAVRALLDSRGFTKTESHLNEWNYLPDKSWSAFSRKADATVRERAVQRMSDAEGAAFVAAAFVALQDAPVDVCNLFHGEAGAFGLFTENGVPTRNYHAVLAFSTLLETPRRVQAHAAAGLAVAAGTDAGGKRAALFLSNREGSAEVRIRLAHLPWPGASDVEVRVVDRARTFEIASQTVLAKSDDELTISLAPPSVALVSFRPHPDPR